MLTVRTGNIGAVRSSAWIWHFSSTHNTIAFSGGAKYRLTTSVKPTIREGRAHARLA